MDVRSSMARSSSVVPASRTHRQHQTVSADLGGIVLLGLLAGAWYLMREGDTRNAGLAIVGAIAVLILS